MIKQFIPEIVSMKILLDIYLVCFMYSNLAFGQENDLWIYSRPGAESIWLLLPISLASGFIGALVMAWPDFEFSFIPWFSLILIVFIYSMSNLISVVSFPKEYGERAYYK